MSDAPTAAKAAFAPLRAAMGEFAEGPVRSALKVLFSPDLTCHMCHPFGDVTGPDALYDRCYAPLLAAMPDVERRDFIVMAGHDAEGALWLGTGGHYMGTFGAPFLDIPPTGHLAAFRYHEFYRHDGDRVTEMQAIWDLPELMLQARAWPMAPQLGAAVLSPGPMTQDGIVSGPYDDAQADHSRRHVEAMLTAMIRHPKEPPEAMELPRFWHPRMNWYGPAGIGTARGMAGFRNWHQIPFLAAMPDRGQYPDLVNHSFFGDGAYCAVTGWPDMAQTLTGSGWLGLPPLDRKITMRSLDFWRMEHGLIRENWVLVDLLHVYDQIGVDPLARMREFNKALIGFDPQTGRAIR
jgi:predicted ester cyclase